MPIQSLEISLIASSSGKQLTENDFLIPLDIENDQEEVVIKTHPGGGFFGVSFVEFFDKGLQRDKFVGRAEDDLLSAASSHLLQIAPWIEQRRMVLIELGSKVELTMLFNLMSDYNEMELILPPEFLMACGSAGLKIQIISNHE